ncbi:MAG: hypothetical protein CMM01_06225 [Rhodopirellula sp.]|nr:hypothetical protein [Rhodopirellula sp.]
MLLVYSLFFGIFPFENKHQGDIAMIPLVTPLRAILPSAENNSQANVLVDGGRAVSQTNKFGIKPKPIEWLLIPFPVDTW